MKIARPKQCNLLAPIDGGSFLAPRGERNRAIMHQITAEMVLNRSRQLCYSVAKKWATAGNNENLKSDCSPEKRLCSRRGKRPRR